MSDTEYLLSILRPLVGCPDELKVTRTNDELGVLLTLVTHHSDMGRVIGRSGEMAKALRLILRTFGMKNNARLNLRINEPEGGRRAPATNRSDSEEFNH